jgi:hypothetical protein
VQRDSDSGVSDWIVDCGATRMLCFGIPTLIFSAPLRLQNGFSISAILAILAFLAILFLPFHLLRPSN